MVSWATLSNQGSVTQRIPRHAWLQDEWSALSTAPVCEGKQFYSKSKINDTVVRKAKFACFLSTQNKYFQKILFFISSMADS